jgi:hypothetical protein
VNGRKIDCLDWRVLDDAGSDVPVMVSKRVAWPWGSWHPNARPLHHALHRARQIAESHVSITQSRYKGGDAVITTRDLNKIPMREPKLRIQGFVLSQPRSTILCRRRRSQST